MSAGDPTGELRTARNKTPVAYEPTAPSRVVLEENGRQESPFLHGLIGIMSQGNMNVIFNRFFEHLFFEPYMSEESWNNPKSVLQCNHYLIDNYPSSEEVIEEIKKKLKISFNEANIILNFVIEDDNSKVISANIIERYLEYCINKIKKKNELFLQMGWTGHSVCFQIKKLEENNYTLVIINSGEGYEEHSKNLNNRKEGKNSDNEPLIIEYTNLNEENIINFLRLEYILILTEKRNEYIRKRDEVEKYIEGIKDIYDFHEMERILEESKIPKSKELKNNAFRVMTQSEFRKTDDLSKYFYGYLKKMKDESNGRIKKNVLMYDLPQVSGSCTFFSCYYYIKYIFKSTYEERGIREENWKEELRKYMYYMRWNTLKAAMINFEQNYENYDNRERGYTLNTLLSILKDVELKREDMERFMLFIRNNLGKINIGFRTKDKKNDNYKYDDYYGDDVEINRIRDELFEDCISYYVRAYHKLIEIKNDFDNDHFIIMSKMEEFYENIIYFMNYISRDDETNRRIRLDIRKLKKELEPILSKKEETLSDLEVSKKKELSEKIQKIEVLLNTYFKNPYYSNYIYMIYKLIQELFEHMIKKIYMNNYQYQIYKNNEEREMGKIDFSKIIKFYEKFMYVMYNYGITDLLLSTILKLYNFIVFIQSDNYKKTDSEINFQRQKLIMMELLSSDKFTNFFINLSINLNIPIEKIFKSIYDQSEYLPEYKKHEEIEISIDNPVKIIESLLIILSNMEISKKKNFEIMENLCKKYLFKINNHDVDNNSNYEISMDSMINNFVECVNSGNYELYIKKNILNLPFNDINEIYMRYFEEREKYGYLNNIFEKFYVENNFNINIIIKNELYTVIYKILYKQIINYRNILLTESDRDKDIENVNKLLEDNFKVKEEELNESLFENISIINEVYISGIYYPKRVNIINNLINSFKKLNIQLFTEQYLDISKSLNEESLLFIFYFLRLYQREEYDKYKNKLIELDKSRKFKQPDYSSNSKIILIYFLNEDFENIILNMMSLNNNLIFLLNIMNNIELNDEKINIIMKKIREFNTMEYLKSNQILECSLKEEYQLFDKKRLERAISKFDYYKDFLRCFYKKIGEEDKIYIDIYNNINELNEFNIDNTSHNLIFVYEGENYIWLENKRRSRMLGKSQQYFLNNYKEDELGEYTKLYNLYEYLLIDDIGKIPLLNRIYNYFSKYSSHYPIILQHEQKELKQFILLLNDYSNIRIKIDILQNKCYLKDYQQDKEYEIIIDETIFNNNLLLSQWMNGLSNGLLLKELNTKKSIYKIFLMSNHELFNKDNIKNNIPFIDFIENNNLILNDVKIVKGKYVYVDLHYSLLYPLNQELDDLIIIFISLIYSNNNQIILNMYHQLFNSCEKYLMLYYDNLNKKNNMVFNIYLQKLYEIFNIN